MKKVTPDMMSEEEADDTEFIRHRPSWRSQVFNRFIEKLDSRFKSKHSSKSLAKPRSYGTPHGKPAPGCIPSWMKSEDIENVPQDENNNLTPSRPDDGDE